MAFPAVGIDGTVWLSFRLHNLSHCLSHHVRHHLRVDLATALEETIHDDLFANATITDSAHLPGAEGTLVDHHLTGQRGRRFAVANDDLANIGEQTVGCVAIEASQ